MGCPSGARYSSLVILGPGADAEMTDLVIWCHIRGRARWQWATIRRVRLTTVHACSTICSWSRRDSSIRCTFIVAVRGNSASGIWIGSAS